MSYFTVKSRTLVRSERKCLFEVLHVGCEQPTDKRRTEPMLAGPERCCRAVLARRLLASGHDRRCSDAAVHFGQRSACDAHAVRLQMQGCYAARAECCASIGPLTEQVCSR